MSSISSIPAYAPVKAPEASAPKPPEAKASAPAPQPSVQAALPPGQGMRIDQIC